MDGSGTLRARGKARANRAAIEAAARGEPRSAPAAGHPHRRGRAAGRKARGREVAHRGAAQADSGDRVLTPDDKAREKGGVTISLLGREFRVGCPEGEEKQLL